MGRAKFSRRSAPLRGLFIMLGLLGAAVLNGAFSIVETWINSNAAGTRLSPWKGVGYAAGFATLVFAGVLWASERLLDDSPFKREQS
jgi:hypothetical protein